MKDDNYELELGGLSGGGHGLPHFHEDLLLLRVGCHRSVLTYHSGLIALASFEPAIRCAHVAGGRTSRDL